MLETESKKLDIAQAAGWQAENLATPEAQTEATDVNLLDPDDVVRPEKLVEKRPFWSRPLPRLVAIGLPSAFVLSMILNFFSPPSSRQANQLPPSPNLSLEKEPQAQRIEELEGQIEDYKVKDALQKQARQLNEKATVPPPSKRQPSPIATATPVLVQPPSRPFSVSPSPIPRAIPRTEIRQLPPPTYRPAPSSNIKQQYPSTSNPVKTQQSPSNPVKTWLEVSNVGNYGSLSTPSSIATSPDSSSGGQISGGTGEPPPSTVLAQANPVVDESSYEPVMNDYEVAQQILVGSSADAILETPIAWVGNLQQVPTQSFLIRLTKPLKGPDGEVVLLEGTYLSAQVNEASGAFLQMTATAALIDDEGRRTEKPLPVGAVLILGERGGVLKAKEQKANTLGNDILTSLFSGVSTATGLLNRPRSQTYSEYGGSINYRNPDYLGGFTQGATQSLVQSLNEQNQRIRSEALTQAPIFVLDRGTKVQVFVNQSIDL